METSSKEEKQNSNDQPSHDSSATDDGVLSLEESVAIYGDQKHRSSSPDMKDSNNLESGVVANTVDTDLTTPITNMDSEIVNSSFGSSVQNVKVPIHVSGERVRNTNSDTKLKSNNDSSEDEYQSADEGGENNVCEEDDGSGEEFIPVGDEDEYTDSGTAFCKNGNASLSDENESDDKESEEHKNEPNDIDAMEVRKNQEASLTEEERQERKEKSQKLKDEGNAKFRIDHYDEAIIAYSEALDICPLNFHKERSIMFANRAACKMKKEFYESAIQDSTCALDLHPHYLKALLRRAELYERTEKLDEALKDYQKAVELDPSQGMARAACVKLAEQIKDRNEKMKEEMIGKLKDLGNLVLRPFGLSVNNFNLQKDPKSGSYSVQFQQNPPNNGS